MKTFLIKSDYEYEIEAETAEEALVKWHETIEDELAMQNESIGGIFSDSLSAQEIK